MTKNEELQEFIDLISKKHMQSRDGKDNCYLGIEDMLHIIRNLNEQIDGQRKIIQGFSNHLEILQNAFTILTRELVKKGHLQLREKRNFLLRNKDTLEALITLLHKKKVISSRELLIELKKKRKEHSNMIVQAISTD